VRNIYLNQRFPKWALPLVEVKGCLELAIKGAKETGVDKSLCPADSVVHLVTTEVSSDQAVGNRFQFIRPIHHIKDVLLVNELLNLVACFIVVFLSVHCVNPKCLRMFSIGQANCTNK
jgi:hypothetical protein